MPRKYEYVDVVVAAATAAVAVALLMVMLMLMVKDGLFNMQINVTHTAVIQIIIQLCDAKDNRQGSSSLREGVEQRVLGNCA